LLLFPLFALSAEGALRGEVPPPVLSRLEALLGRAPNAGTSLVFRLNREDGRYEKGEILTLTIEYPEGAEPAPSDGLLVYADYYLLDGQVAHLLPSRAYPENRLSPGEELVLGAEGGPVRYEALPPFGSERLVLLATVQPLFPDGRPDFEGAEEYLSSLEQAVSQLDPLQVSVLTVETFDKRPETAIAEREPKSEEVAASDSPAIPETLPELETVVASEPPATPDVPLEPLQEDTVEVEEPPRQEAALPVAEDPLPEETLSSEPEDIPPPPEPELSEAEVFYASEVVPRLQRLADAGDDAENLAQLVSAYGTYARLLAENGDHAKALRTLDFALALDFENPELTALREEIAASAQ
jgi:hypothetical protein